MLENESNDGGGEREKTRGCACGCWRRHRGFLWEISRSKKLAILVKRQAVKMWDLFVTE